MNNFRRKLHHASTNQMTINCLPLKQCIKNNFCFYYKMCGSFYEQPRNAIYVLVQHPSHINTAMVNFIVIIR